MLLRGNRAKVASFDGGGVVEGADPPRDADPAMAGILSRPTPCLLIPVSGELPLSRSVSTSKDEASFARVWHAQLPQIALFPSWGCLG